LKKTARQRHYFDEPPAWTYQDGRGRNLFVGDGISSGAAYGTFYRKQNGSLKRFKSPALPMRNFRALAQHDLDRYALKHGLIQDE